MSDLLIMTIPHKKKTITLSGQTIFNLNNRNIMVIPDKQSFNIQSMEKTRFEIQAGGIADIESVKLRKYSWQKLNEIRSLLLQGYYKSALTMALLIPDICSKVTYPELKNLKESDCHRYEKWYNEFVYNSEQGEHGRIHSNFDCFNGKMCYLLRCRLVHGDEEDIEEFVNRPESTFIKTDGYKHVYFELTDLEASLFFIITNEFGEKYAIINHSIPQLVISILSCADKLYESELDKTLFYDGCEVYETNKMIFKEVNKDEEKS